MRTIVQDLCYGLRMLRKNPGFTAVAVITLALGTGANTAIFSIVNAALLRPLPYSKSQRLVHFLWGFPSEWNNALSGLECEYWKQQSRVFDGVAFYSVGGRGLNLATGSESDYVHGGEASKDFFRVLGVQPVLGREFTGEEDRPGGPDVAVLSDGLWRRRFSADPRVIGRQVVLNGKPTTVIGVFPPQFDFVEPFSAPVEVWEPLRLRVDPEDQGHNYEMIARLKPETSLQQAQAQMDSILNPFKRAYPKHLVEGERGVRLMAYGDWISRLTRAPLLLLFGAVGLVLLIATVNVAHLLLSRVASRQSEVAVRQALGASRFRLFRQFVVEALSLSLLGGAAGLLIAPWVLNALLALTPEDFPRISNANLDSSALGFAFLASLLTGLIAGAVPSLRASRLDLNRTLKEGGRTSSSGPGRRLQNLLVVTEVATSIVLLVTAMLFIASLFSLWAVDPGFNPRNVWTFRMSLPPDKFRTTAQVWAFERQVSDRLRTLPGVRSVASVSSLPLNESYNFGVQVIADGERKNVYIRARAVDPQYFQAMGIPLLRGRSLLDIDTGRSSRVVVINEALARECCRNRDLLGRRLYFGQPGTNLPLAGPGWEIIGVAADTKDLGLDNDAPPTIYMTQSQVPDDLNRDMIASYLAAWVVKAEVPLEFTAVQGAVNEIDSTQPVVSLRPLTQVMADSLGVAFTRFLGALLGGFAGMALALAAIGLYGVMSYSVTQRTHEIGLRMALGARRDDVLRLMLGQGLRLALMGTGIGLAASLALTQFLRSLLFGVKPTDPTTFVAVSVLMAGVAALACYIPAQRAAKVDPMVALRYE